MKKYISLFTLALLALAFSFSACSDDENVSNPSTPEEIAASKTSEEAMQLMGLLSAVADVDSLPDNWFEASFTVEPTEGIVLDDAQPYVRSLAVANLKEAVEVYNNLTGQTLDSTATANSWKLEGSGSVNYKAVNQTDVFATIDFSIRQLPHLQQLRLVPAAALGTNATFAGEPHYHLGDVVLDTRDNSFWICARPAYSPAGKGDSHWFSFQLADKNYKTYEATTKRRTTIVPTKLEKNTRIMNYFMNLLYVMANPNNCADLFQKGNVLENGMGELGAAAYSVSMLQEIAQNWQTRNVWKHIPVTPDFFRQHNVDVLYYGYSSPGISNMSLYCMKYSGKGYASANQADYKWDMNKGLAFDAHIYAKNGGVDENKNEVGPGRAIIVRYRKQTDFVSNYKDPTQAMDPSKKTIEDIYLYTDKKVQHAFVPGDVIKDKNTGGLYFCVFPASKEYLNSTKALFVSLDPLALQFSADKKSITNAIEEEDMTKFVCAVEFLNRTRGGDGLRNQKVRDHILRYAGVDLTKLCAFRDSTYMINGTIPSQSESCCFSLLYRDKSNNQMQLMRFIYDSTRCGSNRDQDSGDKMPHLLFMKHYLAGDKALMNWTDVMSQDKVNTYARDIWTSAKFANNTTATPWRTKAEPDKTTLLDYSWSTTSKDFVRPEAKSMFNEPQLLATAIYIDEEQPLPSNFEMVAYYSGNNNEENWINDKLAGYIGGIALNLKKVATMDGESYVPDWVKNSNF